jgi:hypothetical protein
MTQPCVSELWIDRLLAGELAPAEAAQGRAHAAGCAVCRQLVSHAEAIAREFAASPPPLRLSGGRRRRGVAVASAVIAVAAAAVVLAIRPPRDAPPEVRTKGRATLGFFVSHAGELRRGEPAEVVAPADRLQLVVTTERAGWVAVTGVDAVGVRQVYAEPQPLVAGRDRLLPFSIILDDTLGPSTITAVFCAGPFALEQPAADCTTDAFSIETRR